MQIVSIYILSICILRMGRGDLEKSDIEVIVKKVKENNWYRKDN